MASKPKPKPKPSSVPSYHDAVDVSLYDGALAGKVETLRTKFKTLLGGGRGGTRGDDEGSIELVARSTEIAKREILPEVFPSPPKHFRSRCRFQVVKEEVADAGDGKNRKTNLSYRLRENGDVTGAIYEFPMALESINKIMPVLLETIEKEETGKLITGLEAVNFLAAREGGMHVTLVYSINIDGDDKWRIAATNVREEMMETLAMKDGDDFGVQFSADDPTALNLLGRSKGVLVLIGPANYVVERFKTIDGRVLTYHQPEGAFSNPNAFVAEHTVNWLADVSRTTAREALGKMNAIRVMSSQGVTSSTSHDSVNVSANEPSSSTTAPPLPSLLELYCGNGNHTVALASSFASVAAVELSDSLCKAARVNLHRNGITNAKIFNAPSENVARAMLRKRIVGTRVDASTGTCLPEDSEGNVLPSADSTHETPTTENKNTEEHSIKSLDVNKYECVLVDPPRAGLDADTLALVTKFPVILYISCDPNSLFGNAMNGSNGLSKTHAIKRFAVFDHFPWTQHIEVGAAWVRKDLLQ